MFLNGSNLFIMAMMLAININIVLANDDDNICKSMRNNIGAFNIFNVGLTKTKIILVTRDFYVFEMNKTAFNSNKNKLYFTDLPIPISKKYPNLWHNTSFQEMKNHIIDIRIFTGDDGEWLCFIPLTDYGIGYNLATTETTTLTWFVKTNVANERSLGTDEVYYNYVFRYQNVTNHSRGLQFNKDLISDGRIEFAKKVNLMYDWSSLCLNLNNEIYFGTYWCENKSVDWNITGGFTIDNYFYLLGKDFVYSFEKAAFLDKKKSFKFEKQQYRSFIYCKGDIVSKSYSKIIWIILLLILLLLIILCILLFVKIRRRRYIRKSQPPSKKVEEKIQPIKTMNEKNQMKETSQKIALIQKIDEKSQKIQLIQKIDEKSKKINEKSKKISLNPKTNETSQKDLGKQSKTTIGSLRKDKSKLFSEIPPSIISKLSRSDYAGGSSTVSESINPRSNIQKLSTIEPSAISCPSVFPSTAAESNRFV
ncbi:uncharacterized protein LOC113794350 [Dermatophagoides pteronyssinus]|uniref:uncharacterized protein LOC113794350 n=1 Tax=Dermatophagoides pteronyssinus TaxID=6956 RepID=UPI003F675729